MPFILNLLLFSSASIVLPQIIPSQAIVYEAPLPPTLEEKIGDFFLIEIARCESGLRQFDEDGNILRGQINFKDVGLFQINEDWHFKRSVEKKINIHTTDGNIAFAKLLYKEQGSKPWSASKECWQNKTPLSD